MERLTVREVVWAVVAETAPEEAPLLAGFAPMRDADIDRALSRRSRGREPLGFGLETVVALVMPVLWSALSDLAKERIEAGAKGVSGRLREWLRRRSGRPDPPAGRTLPLLEPPEVRQVHGMVLGRCAAAGIAPEVAAAVADGVAVRLLHGASGGDGAPVRQGPP